MSLISESIPIIYKSRKDELICHLEQLEKSLYVCGVPFNPTNLHNSAWDVYYTMQGFIKDCEKVAHVPTTHPFHGDVVLGALNTGGSYMLETPGVSVLDTGNTRGLTHSQWHTRI